MESNESPCKPNARLFLCALCVLCGSLAKQAHAEPLKFSRDVLPILSDNCFACHGPDAKARKANLRLDQKENALANGIVVPGKSAQSELIKRITAANPGEAEHYRVT